MKTEIVQAESNALILQINESGLEPETSQSLKESFMPFFEQAEQWKEKALQLVVTSSDQLREMKEARIARLALKEIRVEVEKKRKILKEDSLRKGKAIDGIANVLKFLIEPIEEHLEAQENYAAIQEKKRLDAQYEERVKSLSDYEIDLRFYDLRNMTQPAFDQLLENTIRNHSEKLELQRKMEEERIAKEKAEAEERERIRIENAKLKAEAEARAKELEKERAKVAAEKAKQEAILKAEREKAAKAKAEAEAKLKAEAEARAKIELELKAKKAAEDKAIKEKELAEKRAAAAPDKQKLIALANTIKSIELPSVKSEEAIMIVKNTQDLIIKLCKFIEDKTNAL